MMITGVAGAVAKVVKDSNGRASLVGYCLVDVDGTSAVQAHCKRVLLPTMVPSVIVALKEFCRLPNGKVDTDKLPQPDWAALAAGDQYVGPSNDLEQQLQRLWMEALQVTLLMAACCVVPSSLIPSCHSNYCWHPLPTSRLIPTSYCFLPPLMRLCLQCM
jgi:hypothetical protein